MQSEENVPLASRTTLGIGGPARRLISLEHERELAAVLADARRASEEIVVLGGGSNVVIADEGLDAWVLTLPAAPTAYRREGAKVEVLASAGTEWDTLVAELVAEGLAGFECLAGIPGQVGATPIQNVGAYGQQIGDALHSVRAYDRHQSTIVELDLAACELGYRDSAFKRRFPGRYIVLAVRFTLAARAPAPAAYPELQRTLAELGRQPTLAEVRETVLALRREKGMVVDAADADSKSAGSFFVNPTVSAAELAVVEARARAIDALTADQRLPHYPAEDDRAKIPAAWLIERAGFARGYVQGNVGLSSRHALALINRGGGTAREIHALASAIQAAVWQRFGVPLRPEPSFLGLEPPMLTQQA